MSKESSKKKAKKGGEQFDPSAFYAQVAENKNLGEQFQDELILRIKKSGDPPKFLFDILADYCHGRRKEEWEKLKEASFAKRLYGELCDALETPQLVECFDHKKTPHGLEPRDEFLRIAVSVTPSERGKLEDWLRDRKYLPLLVIAARFRAYGSVFDRLLREWLLKIDRVLRGENDSPKDVSEDTDRWLEMVMGVKRNPRTLRNYLAPIALAYMQGEEVLKINDRLRSEISSLKQDLADEQVRVKDLEGAAECARRDIFKLNENLEEKGSRIGELEEQLTAEVGLGESSVRNAVGSKLARLRQAVGPDLEDLQALLDRPNPNVTPCLKLLTRIRKNLELDE